MRKPLTASTAVTSMLLCSLMADSLPAADELPELQVVARCDEHYFPRDLAEVAAVWGVYWE